MECETGIWDADECNDAPDENEPDGCSGILILSDNPSKCGSSCLSSDSRRKRGVMNEIESYELQDDESLSAVNNYRAWTLWHS